MRFRDMDEYENEEAAADAEAEEYAEIRHTISPKETFTLAKDVFDLRCYIKSVYSNRAQIARRLNLIATILSALFTVLYAAFMLFSGIRKILPFASEIVIYSFMGLYAVLVVVLIALSVAASRSNTQSVKRMNRALKIVRYIFRAVSLGLGITALVVTMTQGAYDAVGVALDTVGIIFSIIFIILSLFPLLFGSFGALVRWLMSPAKVKRRVSFVALEWYRLLIYGDVAVRSTRKVSKKHYDGIAVSIDRYIVPALGKKYINSVTATDILNLVGSADEGDRAVLEGVLKNIFAYAYDCGYVVVDPCRAIKLEGTIEEEDKKTSIKQKIGKKLGKGILDSIFRNAEEE